MMGVFHTATRARASSEEDKIIDAIFKNETIHYLEKLTANRTRKRTNEQTDKKII